MLKLTLVQALLHAIQTLTYLLPHSILNTRLSHVQKTNLCKTGTRSRLHCGKTECIVERLFEKKYQQKGFFFFREEKQNFCILTVI